MSLTRCIWKQSDNKNQFWVFCQPGEREKWLVDQSIPLGQVLESTEIFCSDSHSHTGEWTRPSSQMLSNAFGKEADSNKEFAIKKILLEGVEENCINATKHLARVGSYNNPNINQ